MAQSVKRVVVWVEPGTWEACVSAAADLVPGEFEAKVLLLYVPDDSEELLRDARAGLWGRGRPVRPVAVPEAPELPVSYTHLRAHETDSLSRMPSSA